MEKKIKLIGVITVSILILCVAIGIYFTVTVRTIKFDEPGFYPINGIKYSIQEGDKAVDDSESAVRIERKNGETIETSALPVFYENRDAVCLMTTMAFYKPAQEHRFDIKKLNLFSEIESIADGFTVKSGSKSDNTNMGFLHDGQDTYIFLQSTQIEFGEQKITLSPLSYAVVNYHRWVQIYDKDTDKYIYEELNGAEVTAVCSDKEEYKINLGTDTVVYGDKEYLFHSVVDMYQSYF